MQLLLETVACAHQAQLCSYKHFPPIQYLRRAMPELQTDSNLPYCGGMDCFAIKSLFPLFLKQPPTYTGAARFPKLPGRMHATTSTNT